MPLHRGRQIENRSGQRNGLGWEGAADPEGQVPLDQIVTHRFPLEEIQKGFDTAYDKTTGSIKVQLHQNSS